VPIPLEGRLWGFMGFDDCHAVRTWTAAELATLSATASSVGEAILRRQDRAALEMSERRYRSVVENVRDVVFQTDAEGRWTFLNPAWAHMTGFPLERTLGSALLNYVHPGDREHAAQALHRLVDEERAECRFEARFLTEADGPRWAEVYAALLRDEDGAVTGTSGMLHDVTERRRAEQQIRESEERLRLALDAAHMATWDHDFRTSEVVWSPRLLDLFGLAEGEYDGRQATFLSLMHEADRDRVAARIAAAHEAAAQTGRDADLEIEYRMRPHGEVRWFRTNGRIYVDEQGVPARVVGTVLDVTDEKAHRAALVEAKEVAEAARAQAEEAARLKSALLANMSHEIRTPLTGIIGFADLLAEEAAHSEDQTDQEEFANLIARNGRRLLDTLNSVLDLAQIEARKRRLRLVEVDARHVASDAAQLLRPQAEAKGLALDVDLPDAPALVQADRPALARVIMNLASNAVKFTDAGTVTVSVAREDAAVVIRVADTGVGIAEAFLPHLFDEFRQESEGEARRYEGSGLGLAITKKLVELLGGTITAESAKDAGSTFTVRLPAVDPAADDGDAAA
ncbi:MAG: PAS domain S-box protein, partial [Rhodothermales bacterium]|nr:PAS domain S-box protein [Rhodothermales bacterium]